MPQMDEFLPHDLKCFSAHQLFMLISFIRPYSSPSLRGRLHGIFFVEKSECKIANDELLRSRKIGGVGGN